MFQTRGLPHVLSGVRLFLVDRLKVLQGVAQQDEGSRSTAVEDRGRTWLKQDREALVRLLSRAEFELADPKAVRRREAIARLKRAAASTKAEHA
jgi:hypothetical protein